VGSGRYPPIEDAPGTYVRETHATHAEAAGRTGQEGARASARAAQGAITGARIEGYDELNVGEVVGRLDNLSAEDLERVRAYEQVAAKDFRLSSGAF
jgi:hypothetical protein